VYKNVTTKREKHQGKAKQQGKQVRLQLKKVFPFKSNTKISAGIPMPAPLGRPASFLFFFSFFFSFPSGYDGHFISLQKHIEPGHLSVRQEISAIIWLPLPESGHKWETAGAAGHWDSGHWTTAQRKLYKLGKKENLTLLM